MMVTAAKPAGEKSAGGHAGEATAPAPAPAPAPAGVSTWPGALRIDAELAESHARTKGAAARIGRLDEKSRPEAVPKQATNKRNSSLAEGYDGGHESTRKVKRAAAGPPRVDEEVEERHARGVQPVVPATDEIERLRDRLKNSRRSGITTRSNGRRPVVHGNKTVLFDTTPKSATTGGKDTGATRDDGVPSARGLMSGGGGVATRTGTSIDDSISNVNRIVDRTETYSCVAAVTGAGAMDNLSESTEHQEDRVKRHRGCGGNEGGEEKKVRASFT